MCKYACIVVVNRKKGMERYISSGLLTLVTSGNEMGTDVRLSGFHKFLNLYSPLYCSLIKTLILKSEEF